MGFNGAVGGSRRRVPRRWRAGGHNLSASMGPSAVADGEHGGQVGGLNDALLASMGPSAVADGETCPLALASEDQYRASMGPSAVADGERRGDDGSRLARLGFNG